jgi:high-affinity Fe2+/Pb2+ permease
MHMGKLNNWFKVMLDYLVMVACVLLMILLLVMTNPSSTVNLQKIFSISVIRWSETSVSSALDHLKELYALIHLPSDNRHHYS